jgi:hypothetical protein
LEFHAKFFVVNPEIAVAPARYRIGYYLLNFLRQDANVWLVAAVVAEAIQTEPVI